METIARASVFKVDSSASNQTFAIVNRYRQFFSIFNSDANDLYLKYGATASATDFTVKIPGGGFWEMPEPRYGGRIDGIWAADGSGSAHITEM